MNLVINLALLFILSFVLSYILQLKLFLRMLRVLAENSYTILNRKVNSIGGENNSKDFDKAIMYVPLANIFVSFDLFQKYLKNEKDILEKMDSLNMLVEFTPEQKKEYKDNPSWLTLLKIMSNNNS